jgi:hypothetical protein
MNKPKILLGLPTMGSINTMTVTVLMGWIAQAATSGEYNLSAYPTYKVTPVDNARNEIVEEFLKSDCSHLFWIDADTVPPADALTKLLRVNQPVVSGLTAIIEHDPDRKNDSNGFYKKWNAVSKDTGRHVLPHTGVLPVIGAGGSCILVKRAVYEKLKDPWYRFLYVDDNGKECFVGEDIQFIAHALQAGFECYVDTSIVCAHEKAILW